MRRLQVAACYCFPGAVHCRQLELLSMRRCCTDRSQPSTQRLTADAMKLQSPPWNDVAGPGLQAWALLCALQTVSVCAGPLMHHILQSTRKEHPTDATGFAILRMPCLSRHMVPQMQQYTRPLSRVATSVPSCQCWSYERHQVQLGSSGERLLGQQVLA